MRSAPTGAAPRGRLAPARRTGDSANPAPRYLDRVGRKHAAAGLLVAAAAAAILVSGGSGADPRTPPALPGKPHPFLGTALIGGGGLTAAVDAYGSVVDLRLPAASGEGQIYNPSGGQSAGAVPAETGIVIHAGAGATHPPWEADRLRQHYRRDTRVLRTSALLGGAELTAIDAAVGRALARGIGVRAVEAGEVGLKVGLNLDLDGTGTGYRLVVGPDGIVQTSRSRRVACRASPRLDAVVDTGEDTDARAELRWTRRGPLRAELVCAFGAAEPADAAAVGGCRGGRRPPLAGGLDRSRPQRPPLGPGPRAPLAAGAAGARRPSRRGRRGGPGPLDLRLAPRRGAAALALGAAGYPSEARRIVRFLLALDLERAARFRADGEPVPGRPAQGDAAGWVTAAARAAGMPSGPAGRLRPA